MNHEKILKRENGRQIRIYVSLGVDMERPYWSVGLMYKEKGKQKWLECVDTNSYSFRQLDREDRRTYIYLKHLEFATEEEIIQAKLELWEKIKPKDAK